MTRPSKTTYRKWPEFGIEAKIVENDPGISAWEAAEVIALAASSGALAAVSGPPTWMHVGVWAYTVWCCWRVWRA